jgi:hypothetical protein
MTTTPFPAVNALGMADLAATVAGGHSRPPCSPFESKQQSDRREPLHHTDHKTHRP